VNNNEFYHEKAPTAISGPSYRAPAAKSETPITRQLLTVKEAAEMAGVRPRSWWRYVSSGEAPTPVRFGGSVRWRRSDLEAWIAAGCPRCRKEQAR
jgi:prophage regulatory protein